MDRPNGKDDAGTTARRKLQVARETLRQLGARSLRNVAGGGDYFTQEGWACTANCPTYPGCTEPGDPDWTQMACMTTYTYYTCDVETIPN